MWGRTKQAKRVDLTPAHLKALEQELAANFQQFQLRYPELLSEETEDNNIQDLFSLMEAVLALLRSLQGDSLEKLFCSKMNKEQFGVIGAGLTALFNLSQLKKVEKIAETLQPWTDFLSGSLTFSNESGAELDAFGYLLTQSLYILTTLLDPIPLADLKKKERKKQAKRQACPSPDNPEELQKYMTQHLLRGPLALANNALFDLLLSEDYVNYRKALEAFKKADLEGIDAQCQSWLALSQSGSKQAITKALADLSALKSRVEQYQAATIGALVGEGHPLSSGESLEILKDTKIPDLIVAPLPSDATRLTFIPFRKQLEQAVEDSLKQHHLETIEASLIARQAIAPPEPEPETAPDPAATRVMQAEPPKAEPTAASDELNLENIPQFFADTDYASVKGVQQAELRSRNVYNRETIWYYNPNRWTSRHYNSEKDLSERFFFSDTSKDAGWPYQEILIKCQACLDQATDPQSKLAWSRKILMIIFTFGLCWHSRSYVLDLSYHTEDGLRQVYADSFIELDQFLIPWNQFLLLTDSELDDYSSTLPRMLRQKANQLEKEVLSLMPGKRRAQLDDSGLDDALSVSYQILCLIERKGTFWNRAYWSNKPKSRKPKKEMLEALWPFEDFKSKFNAMHPGLSIQSRDWASILGQSLSGDRHTINSDRARIYWMLNKQYDRAYSLVFIRDALSRLEPVAEVVKKQKAILQAAAQPGSPEPARFLPVSQTVPQAAVLPTQEEVDPLGGLPVTRATVLQPVAPPTEPPPPTLPVVEPEASAAEPVPVEEEIAATVHTTTQGNKANARQALVHIAIAQNNAYLKARHQRFPLRDAIAFLFSWFFTPEQKKREFYLTDLNKKLQDYAAKGDQESVLVAIDQGIKQFHGYVMTPILLSSLKAEIEALERKDLSQFLPEKEEGAIASIREELFTAESKACFKAVSTRFWFTFFHRNQCKELKQLASEAQPKLKTTNMAQSIQDYNNHYPRDLIFKPLIEAFVPKPKV